MKRYVLHRPWAHARCDVIMTDDAGNRLRAYALPHLVRHSPTGFEWGYAGSGPADLARSIVGDFLGAADPNPRIYQRVKFALLTEMPAMGGAITESQLRAVIDAAVAAVGEQAAAADEVE